MEEDLTDAEAQLVNQIGMVWNAFLALPIQHADDRPDFRCAIHDLQRIVMVRPVMRAINAPLK